MGTDFQNAIDQDNLEQARNNLVGFTGKIKTFNKDIKECNNQYIDEIQLDFINDNPDLTFDEIRLIKKFADYMKNK